MFIKTSCFHFRYLLVIGLLSGCASSHKNSTSSLESKSVFVKYVSTTDGDTIKVNWPNVPSVFGASLPIRIAGIDTPELRTKNKCEKRIAIKAKMKVEQLLSGVKSVELRNYSRDKYFRIVADVYINEVSLADELLSAELAYRYEGNTKLKIDWCALKDK